MENGSLYHISTPEEFEFLDHNESENKIPK